ncbi:hypothetical protein BDW02DRAFT_578654 [Decorospora gaudefroyi]|uniref:Uncharacterized protein n=1 Tax=Decorospora gaudefroyi TaxID=184978 RepID=A0A6A5KIW0_9PLEO|nr:hypothetical protein BDW02DRAFT_578654 [Decorospora gaudefroyi]
MAPLPHPRRASLSWEDFSSDEEILVNNREFQNFARRRNDQVTEMQHELGRLENDSEHVINAYHGADRALAEVKREKAAAEAAWEKEKTELMARHCREQSMLREQIVREKRRADREAAGAVGLRAKLERSRCQVADSNRKIAEYDMDDKTEALQTPSRKRKRDEMFRPPYGNIPVAVEDNLEAQGKDGGPR